MDPEGFSYLVDSNVSLAGLVKGPARDQLSNGVPVYLDRLHGQIAAVSLWYATGSRHESAAEYGATHLLEHLLTRRTDSPLTDWQTIVEDYGGSYNAATGRDFLCFYYQLPGPVALEPLMPFLNSLIATPSGFPSDVMDVEKEIIIHELLQSAANPGDAAYDALYAAVLPQDLGRPAGGTIEEVRRLTSQGVDQASTRVRQSPVGIVASGVSEADLMRLLERSPIASVTVGQAPPIRRPLPPRHLSQADAADDEEIDVEQAVNVGFGYQGVATGDSRRAAFDVVAMIMAGSTSSRLQKELRERSGLVYGLDAWHAPHAETGLQTLICQTSADKAKQVTSIVDATMSAMLDGEAPSEHEVSVARRSVLSRQIQEWESCVERVFSIGRQQLVPAAAGRAIDLWAADVAAVCPQDVLTAAASWPTRRCVVAA